MITLGQLTDFGDDELKKLQEACDLVNKAILDQDFISVLNEAKFDNTDDTNAEIVAKLTAPIVISNLSCENLGWWATHVSHTIAEEDTDGSITFNRAFFQNQDGPSLANTLFHEFCHAVGYSHSSSTDYASVPYQCGDLLEKFLRK